MRAAQISYRVVCLQITIAIGSILPAMAQEQASEGSSQLLNADVRGIVRPANRLDIGTDLIAPVESAPFRDGQAFQKGDVLIRFACQRYRAEWNAAQASAHSAQLALKQKTELRRYGAAGNGEVDIAKADLARSRAEAAALAARLEGCEIAAPFDGRVIELNVRTSEMPRSGHPLMTILDDRTLEIEFVAPSHWLRWIVVGQPFAFHVDETDEILSATVERIAAEVDAISQTIQIVGRIEGDKGRTLAGMSGTAYLPSETTGAIAK
ncbi:efflux RND transporter periplasmic adaptor subunit [Notoacmeibacter sp. MSK16QG-6]|uniref:efflux RND transporter periplasmic adaptor subunit n=1 Tax=Notoacmeibacter sp. MSK16QG-6 TaxID=2957982 RepID=UPI00209E461F|nr:efflux RND transporter periplasmic adaptor subunit [Notoacmeibacter sp. MSK16QG-6]MCP1199609.1 efflux RND transporter periplasmic adaptor subunit [Notoacmeibacter sp. MSK16QG-6]